MKKITRTHDIIVLVLFIILIAICMITYEHQLSHPFYQHIDLTDQWLYETDGEAISSYSLTEQKELPANHSCVISRILPDYDPYYSTLYFSTLNVRVKVDLDGEEIYEYGYGRSLPGDFVHLISLPEDSAGKTLSITIDFPFDLQSFMIDSVELVNGKEFVLGYWRLKLIPVLICIIVLLLAIFCILCSLIIFKGVFENKSLFHAGMFLLLISAWSFTQTQIIPVFFYKDVYYACFAYVLISFMPISLFLYTSTRFELKKTRFYKISEYILIGITLLVNFLGLINRAYYVYSLNLSHVALVYSAILFLIAVIKHNSNIKNPVLKWLTPISMGLLVLCGFFDLINSYTTWINDYSFFTRFSLLIFAISIFMDVIHSSIQIMLLASLSESNQKRAETDALTGLGNRMAFDQKIAEINSFHDHNTIGIIVLDVNNLKITNDTLGHDAGDSLLRTTANIIERCSFAHGFPYRYGGDEFVIIINKDADKVMGEIEEKFLSLMKESSVSIAHGISTCINDESCDILNALKDADQKMYQRKAEMKKGLAH